MRVLLFLIFILSGCEVLNTAVQKKGKRTTGLDDVEGDRRGGEVVGFDPGASFRVATQPLEFTTEGPSISGRNFTLMIKETPGGRPIELKSVRLFDVEGNKIEQTVFDPSPPVISKESPYVVQIDTRSSVQIESMTLTLDFSDDYLKQITEFVLKGNESGRFGMKHYNPNRDTIFQNKAATKFIPQKKSCEDLDERLNNLGVCVPYGKWCSDLTRQVAYKESMDSIPCAVRVNGTLVDCYAASSYKNCNQQIFKNSKTNSLCDRYFKFLSPKHVNMVNIDFNFTSYVPTKCAPSAGSFIGSESVQGP